jgi:hypothetical protein
MRRLLIATPVVLLAVNACLPYTVGSTARTVTPHQTTSSTSWYYIPNAVKMPDDSIATPLAGSNLEFRHGLSDRSDVGLRLLPGGVSMDYKRRLDGDVAGARTAFAYMVGGGIVNGGEHLMLQGTLIASGREDGTVAPYGGLRAIHVLPITEGAVHDKPTIGVFGGLQLGDEHFTIRPELGVFYDRSALGLRRGDLIFVPAVTLRRGRRERAQRTETRGPETRGPETRGPETRDPRRTPVPIFAPRRP